MLHFKLKIRRKSFVSRAMPGPAGAAYSYSAPSDPVDGLGRRGGREK